MKKHLSKNDSTDADLVEICNIGDARSAAESFEILYRRHREFVLRTAQHITNDADIANDVLQETFIYLLRKFPPAGAGLTLTAKLSTLLYPAAKNIAISTLRKAQKFPQSTQTPDELPARGRPRDNSVVAALLSELPPKHQEVLRLRFVEDMSLQEIAVSLALPIGTVKSRLHLAIKQLKNSEAAKNIRDL